MNEIKIHDLNVVMMPIERIKPYDQNPRRNAEAVAFVRKSFKEFGVLAPILLDKDEFIVYGHTRFQAAIEEGLKEYPCVVAKELTPEQARAYRIADNAASERSEWDPDKLRSELSALANLEFKVLQLVDYGLTQYLPVHLQPLATSKEVNFTAKPGSTEMGAGDFQDFEHKCPRCGFEFDGKKDASE